MNNLVQFQFFALGALLALILNGRAPSLGAGVRMGILFGGVLAWLTAQAAFGIRSIGPPPAAISLIVGYMFVAIGCCLLFLGCLGMPRQWLPSRSSIWETWIVCFSLAGDRLRTQGAWPNWHHLLRFDQHCVRDSRPVPLAAGSSIGGDDPARDGVVSVSRTTLLEDEGELHFR